MSTFTKEQLIAKAQEQIKLTRGLNLTLSAKEHVDMCSALFEIALASLEAEPVAWRMRYRSVHCIGGWVFSDTYGEPPKGYEIESLYTAPPAPVSVPDDVLKGRLPDAEKAEFWFEHNGKILFEGVKFNNAVFDACRAAMLQGVEPDFQEISNSSTKHFRENAETSTKCWCRTCRPVTFADSHFVVCPECGNKRCPHANDHRHACTGSNEPGQEGSAYPAAPQQEVK